MSPSQQLVREIYATFAAGDLERSFACLDPGARWCEAEGLPYADGNPYVGLRAIAEGVLQRFAADWSDFRVEVGELAGSGDVVTLFGRFTAVGRATGKPLDAQGARTWWLSAGKVVCFQHVVDTARAASALA